MPANSIMTCTTPLTFVLHLTGPSTVENQWRSVHSVGPAIPLSSKGRSAGSLQWQRLAKMWLVWGSVLFSFAKALPSRAWLITHCSLESLAANPHSPLQPRFGLLRLAFPENVMSFLFVGKSEVSSLIFLLLQTSLLKFTVLVIIDDFAFQLGPSKEQMKTLCWPFV